VEPEEAERVVARALDIGVTLIDTADAYGAGKMEALLGRVLEGHRDVIVVTKVGTDRSTEPPRKNFDPKYLRVAVERSQRRLRRDALDVCLLHNPSAEALETGEPTDTMLALKREGAVRHWGVSVSDVDAARAALARGAEVIAIAYNLFHSADLHRLSGDLMVSGAGVLARSVLSYGLLAGRWTKEHEFPERDHRNERWTRLELERRIEQLDAIRYLVKRDVLTMRGAAVRFALASHLVSAAVLGPRNVEQLEQLVRETGGGPRYLPDDDLRMLPQMLERVGIET
jgi:aryl-alcohol dehydrogenase-like predicted oxidoreductase